MLLDDDKVILERVRVRNRILFQINEIEKKCSLSFVASFINVVLQCDVEDHPGFLLNLCGGSDFVERCYKLIYKTLGNENLLSRNFTLTLVSCF